MSDYIPKVGEVCEMKLQVCTTWREAEIIYISSRNAVYNIDNIEECYEIKYLHFRPIKSARDKAIDEMLEITDKSASLIIPTLYDTGYRKVNPISKDDFINMCIADVSLSNTYSRLVKLGHIVSE